MTPLFTYLQHIPFVLTLVAYGVRDVFILRSIAIFAFVANILYNWNAGPTPAWPPIIWNHLFIAINGYHIIRMAWERRQINFHGRDKFLFEKVFIPFKPVDFRRLLNLGEYLRNPPGATLIEDGEKLDRIFVIVSGELIVRKGGKEMARLGAGQFAGEMSFLTGLPARADVLAATDVEFLCWNQRELKEFLLTEATLLASFEMVLSAQLIEELMARSLSSDAKAHDLSGLFNKMPMGPELIKTL